MMKNIFIAVLSISSAALAYLQFGIEKPEPAPCPPPIVAEAQKIEKISPAEVVKMAEIHGISLETSIDDVDGLIEKAGFDCKKNDNRANSTTSKTRNVSWQCNHNDLRSTINVTASGGQLQHIVRSGHAYKEDMDATRSQLYNLKTRMAANGGLYISQSDDNLTFNIMNKKEDGYISSIRYTIRYMPSENSEEPQEYDGMLTAGITR